MTEPSESQERSANQPSCDPSFSRKQFLELVLKRAALAGAIAAAPVIVDKFLVPPARATHTTAMMEDTSGGFDTTGGGTDID
jgi:hypothetical protein